MSESGVRQRTRAAVVNAAVAVWARDWSASLAEIADRAAVSRSTLHRYFPDRQSLVDAARDRAVGALEESAARGRPASSPSPPATHELEALMRATTEVAEAVIFLFADPSRFAEVWETDADDHADLRAIIVRAQDEGGIDPDVHADWAISLYYSLIYIAAEAIIAGTLARHQAADVSVRTFFRGVGTHER